MDGLLTLFHQVGDKPTRIKQLHSIVL